MSQQKPAGNVSPRCLCLNPIGLVRNRVSDLEFAAWDDTFSDIVLCPDIQAGLTGLERFSHVTVIYYLHHAHFDPASELVRHPFHSDRLPLMGVFARRARERPNPIGLSTVPIISIRDNCLRVRGLDAVDGTPVIDLKPYNPIYDHAAEATVPEWVTRLEDLY